MGPDTSESLTRSASPSDSASSPLSSPAGSEPPSSATTPPSTSSHVDDGDRAKAARLFFSDLDNYLGIGCLVFRELLVEEASVAEPKWQEVTQLPLLSAFEGSLYSHLQSLSAAGWVKLLWSPSVDDPQDQIYRVYVLPFDAGRRFVDRRSKALNQALEGLLAALDVSTQTWRGHTSAAVRFDPWATREDGSLFWMFNTIPSPSPSPEVVGERYAREGLEDLLTHDSLPGLRTQLYTYQKRSAGLMLQRETVSKLELDPRLEQRHSPDGTTYYYSARDTTILRHPRYYESCKGGILSESMGSGKTLMCLALVLATKKHFPKVPARWNKSMSRPTVGSLASMAIAAINRKSVPWQVEFERIAAATGEDMTGCRQRLDAEPASYEIEKEPQRWNRATVTPPPERVLLAATTLVVVPQNLLRQWLNEIKKHLEEDALSVLVMEDSKKPLPAPEVLRTYDLVLFTRKRFEQESRDGSDGQGRRLATTQRLCRCPYIGSTRNRDCTCLRSDDLYTSPLKRLHFLRIVIDEGHFFSNGSGIAAAVAEKLLKVDHRWVVSGTPAKDLLGVEVDMSSANNLWRNPAAADSREALLEQRRDFSDLDKTGAIKALGALASSFLKIRPWAVSDEARAEWEEYIFRHEGSKSRKVKTFSGFSTALCRTLEAMVIKTRPEDVEKDIEMPPLTHEIVRLEPSFYDKLTANLFTLVLTANAVTSERTDQDYLFHKNSAKARYQLVANLRQSAFFWTGFSEGDIQASIERGRKYLDKTDSTCSIADRKLLTDCMVTAETVLKSEGWKSMSRSHELGIFVQDWPRDSWAHWAFDVKRQPLLTGITHLVTAQRHVHERLTEQDPGDGLAGVGITALQETRPVSKAKSRIEGSNPTTLDERPVLTKAGIPTSSLKRRSSTSGSSPAKKAPRAFKVTKTQKGRKPSEPLRTAAQVKSLGSAVDAMSGSARAGSAQKVDASLDARYRQTRVVGTTSAKLSYLISEILKHYRQEKILVFYDGDNAAFYIAQMLDVLHIKYEIYAKSLSASQKSEYAVRFDQEEADRVLLMDVRQAAFGLNLPAASRIYFVNPVCRDNIEAQAIKRAHRIGQTKAVHVETLVLKGTIEEKMLDRSKRMSRAEHLQACHLEDDGGIKQIIQSAKPLPIGETSLGRFQMAPLATPQQLWCREGWEEYQKSSSRRQKKRRKTLDDVDETAGSKPARPQKKVKRTLAFVDLTGEEQSGGNAAQGPTNVAGTGPGLVDGTYSHHPGLQETSTSVAGARASDSLGSHASDQQTPPQAPPFSPILPPKGITVASLMDRPAEPRPARTHSLPSWPLRTEDAKELELSPPRKVSVSSLLNEGSVATQPTARGRSDLVGAILQRL